MLFEIYTRLANHFPSGCSILFGEELASRTGIWIAIDADAYPSLLFSSKPTDTRSDIELRFISVDFARKCEIVVDDEKSASGTYTIVRLEENEPDVVRVFLRLLEETFCRDEPNALDSREIGDRILQLANLFSQLANSPKDVIGLWGELLIISRAKSPEAAVRCWCLDQKAKYDFVCDNFVLEAKTTLKPSRTHRFSMVQLRPHGDLELYIASIQVVEAHGGTATTDLMDIILESITDPELRKSFLTACLIKGGEDIYRSPVRLRLLSSQNSIAYFAAEDIPVPHVNDSAPITNVRFDVCLDSLQQQKGPEIDRLANVSNQALDQ